MDREYRVGEIFGYEGKVLQCVKDFIEVEELKDGMMFRAENGKLYRFTTELKDGEKCSCQTGGYTCSAILRQICSLNPRLWDRLPCERRFVLVDESEKSDGNFESEATPSRRHIEIAVDAVKGGKVTFRIMEAVTEYNLTNGKGYEKPWPQKGDFYYFVDSYITVRSLEYFGSEMDHDMQKAGNFFRTEKEARAALERVKKALRGK